MALRRLPRVADSTALDHLGTEPRAVVWLPAAGSLLAIPLWIGTLTAPTLTLSLACLFGEYLAAECWFGPVTAALTLTPTLTSTPTPTPTPTLTSTPTLTLTQGREALRRGEGQGDRGPDAHHLGLMDRDLGLSQLAPAPLELLLLLVVVNSGGAVYGFIFPWPAGCCRHLVAACRFPSPKLCSRSLQS